MLHRWIGISALLVAATGCSVPVATQAPRPTSDAAGLATNGGLFPADAELLDDTEIARILEFRWQVPDTIRIAMLRLPDASEFSTESNDSYWYWRPESNDAVQTATSAVAILSEIPGVFDVSYLPSFLLPQQKSVGLIREAAARYQADWTLVYSSEFRTNPHNRAWRDDEVFGVGTVEAALIDTRTGIIPFSARTSLPFRIPEQDEDIDLRALTLRAEQEVLDDAMAQVAQSFRSFVAKVRQQ